jgi:hypothetical protein
MLALVALPAAAVAPTMATAAAAEDIEFVAEHLAEVAMDNRYSTLPVWSSLRAPPAAQVSASWASGLLLGYSRTRSGELSLGGPTLAGSLQRRLGAAWSATAYGFYDRESFSGRGDQRPLRSVAFSSLPLPLPAAASFDSRGGHMTHAGIGLAFARSGDGARLGRRDWVVGLQLERILLRGYAFDYRILAGPAADTRGTIDFDASYDHVTPFAGVELPRRYGRWTLSPHALLAVPFPRRGIQTHITGPGFDLRGDTDAVGNGKHFGDASLALGVDATFEPWGLSVDLGSTLTQATLERIVHTGIDSNWSLALGWRF